MIHSKVVLRMKVSIRSFEENDLFSLQIWADEIEAHKYMSRVLPHKSDQYFNSQKSLLAWYVIQVDNKDVGTVWLEKADIDDEITILGILIGKNNFLGQGIGEQAINIAIEKSFDVISFKSVRANVRVSNKRAIHCYRNCGFLKISQGIKVVDGIATIPFMTLELKLK